MSLERKAFVKTLCGYSGKLKPGEAWNSGKILMDRLWETVRSEKIQSLGINHWYYGPNQELFVGVEIPENNNLTKGLEKKEIRFNRFVHWKHTGNFSEIRRGYDQLTKEIQENGYRQTGSSLEIYGHDTGSAHGSEMEILIEVEDK